MTGNIGEKVNTLACKISDDYKSSLMMMMMNQKDMIYSNILAVEETIHYRFFHKFFLKKCFNGVFWGPRGCYIHHYSILIPKKFNLGPLFGV